MDWSQPPHILEEMIVIVAEVTGVPRAAKNSTPANFLENHDLQSSDLEK